jgi:S1-C subfamily serine protease
MSTKPFSTSSAENSSKWQAAITDTVSAVVSIRYARPYYFDTEAAGTGGATGFIVCADRGYILTNRHVVGPGPFSGYCIFDNHEECQVYPVYYGMFFKLISRDES